MSEKILATIEAKDFIGRNAETESLLRHAKAENSSRGLLVLSAPAVGASELLKQIYDSLFREAGDCIPFYFSLNDTDKSAEQFAIRFLQTFLCQTVAFRRGDRKIIDASPDVCELAELAAPSDGYWIDRLLAICQTESKLNDKRSFIKTCLSAPLRAAARGAEVFVMIDNLHEAEYFADEINLIEEIKEIYSRANVQFVLAGRRRFLLDAAQTRNARLTDAEVLRVEPLTFSGAGLLAENLAENFKLKINEQTRDLMARQLDANPTFINFLFNSAASEKNSDLDSFQRVEQSYARMIFDGRINKFYDTIFQKIAPNVEIQKNVLGLLFDALTIQIEKTPIESWQRRIGLGEEEFYRLMRLLNTHEIIRLTSNLVEAMSENKILTDYVTSRFRLEIAAENRALVVGEMLSAFLKRAPRLMADFYRRASAVGLRELLSVFNSQKTPLALLDYSIFKERYKGAEDEAILEHIKENTENIRLPQIVYTAHTVAFYPAIGRVTEKERSAVALGFEETTYTDEDETVWIAAEIDSKLEASKESAEFWCDRLEMVALMCNFLNYRLWLVAPEGFTPEACEVLQNRNAYGSSRKQIELLINFLDAKNIVGEKAPKNEFEIVVPMGEDTEMIAAHAVEEIARKHRFAPKAINQIKTALVEACINATEHSLSPDRKIYQKFAVESDKIVITISNRGLRLADKKAVEFKPDEGRRGWGLKLMETLMDEVKFEQVDDGTRISMTKYVKPTKD